MSTKKTFSQEDIELNLKEVFLILWKEKILILSVSLALSVLGYIYGNNIQKVYHTTIELKDISPLAQREILIELVEYLNELPAFNNELPAFNNYNNKFNSNLISEKNFLEFLKKENIFKTLDSYLVQNNLNVDNIFEDRLILNFIVHDKKKDYIGGEKLFTIAFDIPFIEADTLSDYVIFIKKKTDLETKKIIINEINSVIKKYKKNLIMAELLELDKPFTSENYFGPIEPFFKGTTILTQELTFLKQIRSDLLMMKIEYYPIFKTASSPTLISKSPTYYALLFLIIGIIISFLIILLKYTFKDKI